MTSRVFLTSLAVMAIAVFLVYPDEAMAGTLRQTCRLFHSVWVWLRGVVYVLSAISLVFMSFQASIMGRFSMGRLVVWGGALFALSSAPGILRYLVDGAANLSCP